RDAGSAGGSVSGAGGSVTGGAGGMGPTDLAPCSCVDPTTPMTTLAACVESCNRTGLAGCNWGHVSCGRTTSGECRCSPYGVSANGAQNFCDMLGLWHAHSQPWNGLPTDATVTFKDDWTLLGEPEFHGKWSLDQSTLTISETTGNDMDCPFPDQWTVQASPDCMTLELNPIASGCTGGRRDLYWNVTITRN